MIVRGDHGRLPVAADEQVRRNGMRRRRRLAVADIEIMESHWTLTTWAPSRSRAATLKQRADDADDQEAGAAG